MGKRSKKNLVFLSCFQIENKKYDLVRESVGDVFSLIFKFQKV